MNFKSIGLNVAAATVMATGAAIASLPAQAVPSFNQGTFTLTGSSTITDLNPQTSPNSFNLNFQDFTITDRTGGFVGALGGTPSLASLFVTKNVVTGIFSSAGLDNFVTGLTYNGEAAFLDINPFSFAANSFVTDTTSYGLATGKFDITGVLRTASLSSVSTASLGAIQFAPLKQSKLVVDVPTPALLPGLIGLGVAALRKRKAEASKKALVKA